MQSASTPRPAIAFESGRPGWRWPDLVKLAFGLLVLFNMTSRLRADDPPHQVVEAAVAVALVLYLSFLVDRAYATFSFEAANGTVSIRRRGPLLRRSWRCYETEFSLQGMDSRRESNGGRGARFLEIFVRQKMIRFMEGHSKDALIAAQARIWRWLESGSATD